MKKTKKVKSVKWTVVGYYKDNNQRWAEVISAPTADEAEDKKPAGIVVVGVAKGDVNMYDTDRYIHPENE